MKTTTINISLPVEMYQDAKEHVKKRRFSSVSEFFREAIRSKLYPELTENGFTPEFEQEVLEAKRDYKNDIVWDGRGSYKEFIKKHILHDG